MISAFRRAASFRGDSAVTTWLHRIVVNACLDKIRRRSSRPEVSGSDDRLFDVVAAGDAADPASGSEVSIEVAAALRGLPRDQQMALVLVDMLDYPVADAAEILGVAQGTVKSRCARGRARLLPRLAHLRQAAAQEPPGSREPSQSLPPSAPPQVPASSEPTSNQEGQTGNRFGTGAVLPAQEGSDEPH